MRYLTVAEVIELHARIVSQSGGAAGLRDRPALESSLAQSLQTFAGEELYPTVEEKAAALGYFLISKFTTWVVRHVRPGRLTSR